MLSLSASFVFMLFSCLFFFVGGLAGGNDEDFRLPKPREWQTVRLKPCPAGEHRINYTSGFGSKKDRI